MFELNHKRSVVPIQVQGRWNTDEFFLALQGELEPYFESGSYQLMVFDNRMAVKAWHPINKTPQAFQLLYQQIPTIDAAGAAVLMLGDKSRIKVMPVARKSKAKVRPSRQDEALTMDIRNEWALQAGNQKRWTPKCTDLMKRSPQENEKFTVSRSVVCVACGAVNSWKYLLNPLELLCPCCNKIQKMVSYTSSSVQTRAHYCITYCTIEAGK